MSISYNPRIVTDGLAFCMDAINSKSYPGSGTDVIDLSGQGYDGTVVSLGTEVSYNSSGWFDFTGSDGASITYSVSDISTDPSLYLTGVSGEITYETWCYPTAVNANDRIMSTDRSDYNCLMWSSSNRIEWSVDNAQFFSSNDAVSANNWWHIVGTASRSAGTSNNVKIYVNGELESTHSRSIRNPMGDGSTRPFGIGSNVEDTVRNDSCFQGRIAICRIYGKALSGEEVKQNYNATKSRFQ